MTTSPTPATPITAEQIAELKEALANATKGEWKYRPHEFDDWGFIRGEDDGIVAISRDGGTADLHAHRDAKTDPYEPNGRFFVLAHNLLPSLIAAAEEVGRLKGVLAEIKHLNSIDLGSNMEMYAFAKELKRQNEAMREALASFDMVTPAHKVEIAEKASGASVVLTDDEFDCGFGASACNAVYAWTATKVIAIDDYDGATSCFSIPRHPISCLPIMPGG